MKQMSVGSTLPFIRYGTRAVRHYGRGGGGSGSDIRDSTRAGTGQLWDNMNSNKVLVPELRTFKHNGRLESVPWILDS